MAAINITHQALKFIVPDRSLVFLQQFPFWRIGQRIAEVIDCDPGRGPEEAEVEEEEEPRVEMTRDHGLDFPLFNTMLAEC